MIKPPNNSSLYRSPRGYQKVVAHYDMTFQEMGLPYETEYVETPFGPTHTVICGDKNGKAIVLWHGLNANSTTWARWLPTLASSYRVYAIDTIGGMGRSAPCRPSKRGAAYGQWAAAVLEGLGLEQANMIGTSNGGWLILKLSNVAPHRISTATLLSSAGFHRLSLWLVLRMIPPTMFKPPAEAGRQLLSLLSSPDLPPDPFFLEFFELMLASQFRSEANAPVLGDDEIRQLTAPTYLLMGQYEASFNPYSAAKRGVALLPNLISAEIVPGVGHSMLHRQPDWVITRILRFLEGYAV